MSGDWTGGSGRLCGGEYRIGRGGGRLSVCRYVRTGGVSQLNENSQLHMCLLFLTRELASAFAVIVNCVNSRNDGNCA